MTSVQEVKTAVAPQAVLTIAEFDTLRALESLAQNLARAATDSIDPAHIRKLVALESDFGAARYSVEAKILNYMIGQEPTLGDDVRAALPGQHASAIDRFRSDFIQQAQKLAEQRTGFEDTLRLQMAGMAESEIQAANLGNCDGYSARGQIADDVRSASLGSAVFSPRLRGVIAA